MGFHPSEDKIMVFGGDKEGHLGMFDATAGLASEEDKPTLNCFKVHARTITSILFTPHDPSSVYTASYDASIRKMDLSHGKAIELWAPQDPDDDEHAVRSLLASLASTDHRPTDSDVARALAGPSARLVLVQLLQQAVPSSLPALHLPDPSHRLLCITHHPDSSWLPHFELAHRASS